MRPVTVERPFILFGGPFDGLRETYPGLPSSLWVGPCCCGSDRPCGGVTVISLEPEPNPLFARIASGEGFVEYKRDVQLEDGTWRYVYAGLPEAGDGRWRSDARALLDGLERDRDLVGA